MASESEIRDRIIARAEGEVGKVKAKTIGSDGKIIGWPQKGDIGWKPTNYDPVAGHFVVVRDVIAADDGSYKIKTVAGNSGAMAQPANRRLAGQDCSIETETVLGG